MKKIMGITEIVNVIIISFMLVSPTLLFAKCDYESSTSSILNTILELSDGGFLVAGDEYGNNKQLAPIDEYETETFYLYLLPMLDNAHLETYACKEFIRNKSDFIKKYNIGNQWIYEEEHNLGAGNVQVGYKTFEVLDILQQGSRTKYVVDEIDTFYVENEKMYFWDDYYQEYIMYYDWDETGSYEIKYYNQFTNSEEVATVIIDSISFKHFGGDSLKVQQVRILNSGTMDEYRDVVYEGVGAGFYGIKFLLGCALCDDNRQATILRCFITDTMTYHFVPYSCDSSWTVTGTDNPIVNNITIYPVPVSDMLHVKMDKGTINQVRIIDMEGRVVFHTQDDINEHTVNIPTMNITAGNYIIEIKSDGKKATEQIVITH